METAVFGGGCFWCLEAIFSRLKGVSKVTSGYAGGHDQHPTYEIVCSGRSGHAEVISVAYNPDIVSYNDLLEVFFKTHDPTTLNRQGADIGSQYRSIILYKNASQKASADQYIENLKRTGEYNQAVVTEIKPLDVFYAAEDYHKDYYKLHSSQPYCRAVIEPKLAKLFNTKKS